MSSASFASRAADPHRQRVNLERVFVGECEEFEQTHRLLLEEVIAGNGEPAALDDKAVQLARGTPQHRQPEAPPAPGELLVEMRQEHAGQIARRARLQEIIMHEAFDLGFARSIGKAHPLGNLALQIEGQPVFAAPGNVVQMAAHRPQEILGAVKLAVFVAAEQSGLDQLCRLADIVCVFSDPEERVEIAQAALRFLDVGLDDIARVAHLLVAHVALGQLVGDELACGVGLHLDLETTRRLFVQRSVAPHVARFQQGGTDRHVAFGLPHHFVERTAAMADLQPEVPQSIQHRLDHLLGPAGLLPGGEEADIEIRIRCHLAAAIAADRDDRQPFGSGRVAVGIQPLHREIVE